MEAAALQSRIHQYCTAPSRLAKDTGNKNNREISDAMLSLPPRPGRTLKSGAQSSFCALSWSREGFVNCSENFDIGTTPLVL